MANYLLTAAASDSLVGADGVADAFLVGQAGQLVGTDTIRGGIGATLDAIVVQAAMTLAAADFANVHDVERVSITAAAGAAVTLADAMVASGDLVYFHGIGGGGADTISGAGVLARALNLGGGGGDDSLLGGGGADLLAPGTGADTALGGAGNDTFASTLADLGLGDVLDGGAGALDVLRLTTAGGVLRDAALAGFERIQLDAALTTGLTFRLAAQTAASAAAVLTIAGAGGADVVVATAAAQSVALLGEGGADRLVGGRAGDLLAGGAANDTLNGYLGDDTIEGGEGNDRIMGSVGNDLLLGGAGNDSITGGAGNDTIDAGTGTDTLDGGVGDDWVRLASQAINAGHRAIDEDGAADVLEITGTTAVVVVGASAAMVALGFERIIMGAGADFVLVDNAMGDSAGAEVMTIEGGGGNDRLDGSGYLPLGLPLRFLLRGDAGSDTLRGGSGADTLDAGAGAVVAAGGAGDDLIIVAPDALAQSVIDGGTGSGDVLRLSDGGAVASGDLAGMTGIELIELSDEGNSIVVPQLWALPPENAGFVPFILRGGMGDDLVDRTPPPLAGNGLLVQLGAGDDTFLGGAANDVVEAGSGNDRILLGTGANRVSFGAGEFSALDVVTASTTNVNDRLDIALVAGRTLGAAAFDGIAGIDVFYFQGAAGAAVRLPSDIVSQSGQASVYVGLYGSAGAVIDGRGTGPIRYETSGDSLIIAGSGNDTIQSYSGNDTLIGGDGGDRISLNSPGSGSGPQYAVIVSEFDGSDDINTTVRTDTADRVSGTDVTDKFIAVEWQALGLASGSKVFVPPALAITFDNGANILDTANEIAGNAFGSLTAVRNAVGARMGGGTIGDRTILVIGGADELQFGVYLFQDGDNNATIDAADTLRLLAIGSGDVETFASGGSVVSGFTLVDLDLF